TRRPARGGGARELPRSPVGSAERPCLLLVAVAERGLPGALLRPGHGCLPPEDRPQPLGQPEGHEPPGPLSELGGTRAAPSGHAAAYDDRVVSALDSLFRTDDDLRLDVAGTDSLATWFLGPKAENGDLLRRLAERVVQAQVEDRNSYQPSDPPWVTDEIKASQAYKAGVQALEAAVAQLVERLRGSVPFFSYRYQAHMLWDTTLPAVVGYLAAVLYNQNNVAAEASPVTTALEIEVGQDLGRTSGYSAPPGPVRGGHIPGDGSVANIESMWAARNLKYFPVALAAALEHAPRLQHARGFETRLPDGRSVPLVELDAWGRLNLGVEEALAVPKRTQDAFGDATC